MAVPEGRSASSGARRRGEVLDVLRRATSPRSVTEIADELGVHPNTVRFHLEKLVESDRVERVAAQQHTPGRPPHLFRAVPGMDQEGPRDYRMLAGVLAGSLLEGPDPSARAAEAGRAWGREQDTVGAHRPTRATSVSRLNTMLAELGFAPERDDEERGGGSEVRLRHCPFLELASSAPEITCPVHLGLMQGALESWEAPITVDRLEPFVEPDLCVAHLASVTRQ